MPRGRLLEAPSLRPKGGRVAAEAPRRHATRATRRGPRAMRRAKAPAERRRIRRDASRPLPPSAASSRGSPPDCKTERCPDRIAGGSEERRRASDSKLRGWRDTRARTSPAGLERKDHRAREVQASRARRVMANSSRAPRSRATRGVRVSTPEAARAARYTASLSHRPALAGQQVASVAAERASRRRCTPKSSVGRPTERCDPADVVRRSCTVRHGVLRSADTGCANISAPGREDQLATAKPFSRGSPRATEW